MNDENYRIEKLEIVEKDNYVYTLKNRRQRKYTINIEFVDIEEEPKIGDYIYINEKLLNPNYDGYSTSYTFGNIQNKYGKYIVADDLTDVIKLSIDKKTVYLKRLYG